MIQRCRKSFWCILAIVLVGIVLLYKLTHSGLWIDEAIEYWYSKTLLGPAPGGRIYNSMYERICSTYQPPLYNWLLYLWLHIWDTEFGFRFFGVIVSLFGCIGVFLTVNYVTSNHVWSFTNTLLYGITYQVVYYSQECAEYYLVLAMIIWMYYFAIRTLQDFTIGNLIGFYVFSVLAVYSQYGAAFAVVGMWVAVVWKMLRTKKLYIEFGVINIVTLLIAVIPLLKFFLIPQMQTKVLSIAENHYPEFKNNVVFDLISSFSDVIRFNFLVGKEGMIPKIAVVGLVIVLCVILYGILKNKKAENDLLFKHLMVANIVTWIVLYMAVKCKFYAYTNYLSGFQTRYVLFLLPIWIMSFGIFLYFSIQNYWEKHTLWKWGRIALICFCVIYGLVNLFFLRDNWIKDDLREVIYEWDGVEGEREYTFIDKSDDAIFQYYLVHDDIYTNEYQGNILQIEYEKFSSYDEIEMHQFLQDIFDNKMPKNFYCVTLRNANEEALASIFMKCGYEVEYLYQGIRSLLQIKMQE